MLSSTDLEAANPGSTMRRGLRLLRAGAISAALVLALSSCGSDMSFTAPAAKDFPADTPELIAAKEKAGVEACPEPQTKDGGLPSVILPCLGGGSSVDLSTLTGPLIINVWSSACEPCRKEMPALGKFHRIHGDVVPLLGIDLEDTYPGVALQQAGERKATYPQLFDFDGEIQKTKLRVPGLPTFLFLAEDGTVTTKAGGLHTYEEVVEMVNEHLGLGLT